MKSRYISRRKREDTGTSYTEHLYKMAERTKGTPANSFWVEKAELSREGRKLTSKNIGSIKFKMGVKNQLKKKK